MAKGWRVDRIEVRPVLVRIKPVLERNTLQHSHVSTVAGFKIFEHARKGDESPYLIQVDGLFYSTESFDLPEAIDLADLIRDIRAGRIEVIR